MNSASGQDAGFPPTGRSTSTRSVSSGTCSPVIGCSFVRPPQRVTGLPLASRSCSVRVALPPPLALLSLLFVAAVAVVPMSMSPAVGVRTEIEYPTPILAAGSDPKLG